MRLKGLTKALVAVAALAGCLSPAAVAQPAGNVVVFGDSFAANPDQQRHWAAKVPGMGSSDYLTSYPTTGGCLQGPDNWPRQLGYRTGQNVRDWSCSGATSWTIMSRINGAIRTGDLHPGTRAVVLAVGINDYWPNNVINANTRFDQVRIQNNYVANMHAAAARVREVAPNARIIMPGMLAISEPWGAQRVCLINVVPNLPGGVPVPIVQRVETLTRDNQIRAAREIGATYIDLKQLSAGHNTCARDNERWVAGYIDTTTRDYNMAYHPSRAGSAFVAGEVARFL